MLQAVDALERESEVAAQRFETYVESATGSIQPVFHTIDTFRKDRDLGPDVGHPFANVLQAGPNLGQPFTDIRDPSG